VPDLRLAWTCIVAVAGLFLAGTAASTSHVAAPAQPRVVVIENVQFNPQKLTVKSGERISWVNKDLFPHTATADAKAFDSRAIAPNASWVWVAGKPGTYTYACAFHPTMKGTVTVQ
jgi:plastocyanin